jgi:hypothetical protein
MKANTAAPLNLFVPTELLARHNSHVALVFFFCSDHHMIAGNRDGEVWW